jgi:hypothetical protein
MSLNSVIGLNGTFGVSDIFLGNNLEFAQAKISIGNQAGQDNQSSTATAIGNNAGQNNQGVGAISIGTLAGVNNQLQDSVAIGTSAGADNQQQDAVSIGRRAGNDFQGEGAVAVGNEAGEQSQGNYSVAVGYQAGFALQDTLSVAVGPLSGENSQSSKCVAVGNKAGQNAQSIGAVAVGFTAGSFQQSQSAVAIGSGAGTDRQGEFAIAIGTNAGEGLQGANSIAIGKGAGESGQPANSIILNASGSGLNPSTASALYVSPVRANLTGNVLYYDTTSKEVSFGSNQAVGSGGQNWVDVSNSRALFTVYTNDTGRAIMVAFSGIVSSDTVNRSVQVTVSANPSTASVKIIDLLFPINTPVAPQTEKITGSFIVPPTGSYSISQAGGTAGNLNITSWCELR